MSHPKGVIYLDIRLELDSPIGGASIVQNHHSISTVGPLLNLPQLPIEGSSNKLQKFINNCKITT